jgi:transposase
VTSETENLSFENLFSQLATWASLQAIKVGARDWLDRLAVARTGDGRTLGVALLAEIRREAGRLPLVEHQIKEVEAAQHAALKADTALVARACKLKRLRGLGEVFASGLTHEAFWRDFGNRRQVGGAFGLTPWPWDSGDMHSDQPISKVGNRRARTMAIECAWMWTLHQPGSALTRWWHKRFAGGGRRLRRIGIVALARKLMIALWRYLKEDLVPEGAVLT